MPPKAQLQKTVCRKCNRMVHVMDVDGGTVITDTELIAVVVMGEGGGPVETSERVNAKRIHAEMCLSYKAAAERKKLQAQLRRGR